MAEVLTDDEVAGLQRGLGHWASSYDADALRAIAGDLSAVADDRLLLRRAILGWCFEELMATRGHEHDVSAGASSGKRGQVWAHLKSLADRYAPYLRRAMGTGAYLGPVRARIVPEPVERNYPDGLDEAGRDPVSGIFLTDELGGRRREYHDY